MMAEDEDLKGMLRRDCGPAGPPKAKSRHLRVALRNRDLAESGRLDLNQRPPAPKAGALPGCATPRKRRRLSRRSGAGLQPSNLEIREMIDELPFPA